MKASTFQVVLVGNWLLSLATSFVPQGVFSSDPRMLEFLQWDGAGSILGQPLYTVCFWSFFAAYTGAQFGMLYFHGWARYLFLLTSVLNVMFQFWVGVRVTYPAFSAANQLVLLTDGAILALAYYSPLARYFEMKDPGDPGRPPEHGPDEIVLR